MSELLCVDSNEHILFALERAIKDLILIGDSLFQKGDYSCEFPLEDSRQLEAAIVLIRDVLPKVKEENRKLRSMCKAAAAEIDEHWQAHCDKDGYGPVNLMSRLEGRLPPDLYPGYDT